MVVVAFSVTLITVIYENVICIIARHPPSCYTSEWLLSYSMMGQIGQRDVDSELP